LIEQASKALTTISTFDGLKNQKYPVSEVSCTAWPIVLPLPVAISRSEARRFRRQHALRFACIPLAFLGLLLPTVLPPPPPDWLLFVPAAWFFGFLTFGLFGVWLTERRILRLVDPDPETGPGAVPA
jgi:hypothetical protein